MRWFRRTETALPDEVAARLSLQPGDRALAFAKAGTDGWVVATEHGLHDLPADRPTELLGWHEIDKAVWRGGTLVVVEAAERSGAGRGHRYPLSEPGRLPEVVRDRVTASIVRNDKHLLALPSGQTAGVRIVGRRVPGEPTLRWRAVLDRDVDASDPVLQAGVQRLLADAQAGVSAEDRRSS